MKKVFFLIFTLLISVTGMSQTFVKAEYFFDNDPGIGNGTSIPLALPGDNISFTTSIPTVALVPGFHMLALRILQNDGVWGVFESRGFYISSATSNASDITAAEYFFDTDPGAGNGTALAVTPGPIVNFTVVLPATALLPGFHFLAIRTKGADGKWGIFESRGFYISESTANAANITAAEYFFDSDPGSGNGIAIPVTTGPIVSFTVSLPAASLSPGFHFLAIRTKGADGRWGVFESRGFYVSAATADAANIVGAEYFFDNDPGTGNGTPITIPSGAISNFTVSLPAGSLASGFHNLTIRIKSSDGKWGIFETRGFYISTETQDAGDIVAAEYFFDVDPGEGNAQPLTVTPGSIVNQTFALPVPNNLTAGTHSVSIRVQSSKGIWSVKESGTFTVLPNQIPIANAGSDQNILFPVTNASLNGSASSDPDGTISSFLWNKISGPAAGTIANTNQAVTNANNLVDGVYKFELTVTDNNGTTDKDTVQITVVGPPNQVPIASAGVDQIIASPANSTILNGSASSDSDGSLISFAWVKISGPASEIIVSPNQSTTLVNNLVVGVYRFELTVTDNNSATDKDTIQVTVSNATVNTGCPQVLTITLRDNLLICNPAGSSYQWFKDGLPVNGAVSQIFEINLFDYGIYAVEVTENGCTERSADFVYLITDAETDLQSIQFYPNPFNDKLIIEAPANFKAFEIQIIDALGRSVLKQKISSGRTEINAGHLSQGIYYIRTNRNTGYKIQKL